eukprot:c19347_g2_i2.p1 GENE.c19347_g2_i2~~c19347_g2_i2.p1  ORF type:complete len:336 (-),score=72.92 c19347_g2_i2:96-1103(-)
MLRCIALMQSNPRLFGVANPIDSVVGVLKAIMEPPRPNLNPTEIGSSFGQLCHLSYLMQVLFVSAGHTNRMWQLGGVSRIAKLLEHWNPPDGIDPPFEKAMREMQGQPEPEQEPKVTVAEVHALTTMLWNLSSVKQCATELASEPVIAKLVYLVDTFPGATAMHQGVFETLNNLTMVDEQLVSQTTETHSTGAFLLSLTNYQYICVQSDVVRQRETTDQLLEALEGVQQTAENASWNDLECLLCMADPERQGPGVDPVVLVGILQAVVALGQGRGEWLIMAGASQRLKAAVEACVERMAAHDNRGADWITFERRMTELCTLLQKEEALAVERLEE